MTEKVERRLAAILAADVVGYSRLVVADEEGTIARLRALREKLLDLKIAEHQGRTVKLMGDGALVEFASVVDAVRCAAEIQREMATRNADIPEDRRIVFRIGINLGDIVIDGDDIQGDGVNIAARLEQLSEPGGIIISGTAFDHARNKVDVGFEDRGPQQVKNIPDPVRAYRVLLDEAASGSIVEHAGSKSGKPRRARWMVAAAAAAVVMIAAVVGALFAIEPWVPRVEAAVEANMAYPLPEVPSIAVMPFENLSGDPEQDYLADGITDSIITTLAQTKQLFVIARNSTFAYKGKPVTPKEVAEAFGVGSVLEGSFQKSKDQVRIAARLIDVLSGRQLWAGRYDRPMDDIFAMQDDITYNIVEELQVKLTVGEKGRLWRKGWHSPEAYQISLRALSHWHRPTATDLERAVALSEEAIALDPEAAGAYASLGWNLHSQYLNGWAPDPAEAYKRAVAAAEKAISLDDTLAAGHELMSWIHSFDGNHDAAIAEVDKVAKLAPGTPHLGSLYANVFVQAGRAQEAIEWFNRAKRLDPKIIPQWHWTLAEAYRQLGRFEEMIETSKWILASNETFWFEYPRLVYAYVEMGQMDEAKKWLDKMLDGHPERVQVWPFIVSSTAPEPREKFISALVKAGFPDPNAPVEPEPEEAAALPLPDKPSIVVLPFDNLSDDSDQEWFADGMTDDLITDLSKISGLFVIARNSSFAYKSKAVDLKTVGRELGVKYVLEGSVRRVDEKVRINTQLVDVSTGGHVWAERYDRELDNIFTVQDAILGKIVQALELHLTDAEQEHRDQRPKTTSLEAYDLVLKARKLLTRFEHSAAAEARDLLQRAIEIDPAYSEAHSLLGFYYFDEWRVWARKRDQNLARALELATTAVELTPFDPAPHVLLALVYQWRREFDGANAAADRALALQPNDAITLSNLGSMLNWAGRAEEALAVLRQAIRLDPFHPPTDLERLASAYAGVGDHDLCVETAKRGIALEPNYVSLYVNLAGCFSALGREEEARAAVAEILRTNPRFTLKAYASYVPFTNEGDLQREVEVLRQAGVPESADQVFRAPEGHMTGVQIRVAISGQTFVDTLPKNFAGTTMSFDPSGAMDGYPQPGSPVERFGSDTGKWWIDGDKFCRQWTRWQRGQPGCFSLLIDEDAIQWINRFGQFHSAMTRLD